LVSRLKEYTNKHGKEIDKELFDRAKNILETLASDRKKAYANERALCIDTLVSIKASDSAPVVLRLLKDPDHEVRIAAIRAVAAFGIKKAVKQLEDIEKSDTYVWEGWKKDKKIYTVRQAASAALKRLKQQ
jgi:HEAT repeat protein